MLPDGLGLDNRIERKEMVVQRESKVGGRTGAPYAFRGRLCRGPFARPLSQHVPLNSCDVLAGPDRYFVWVGSVLRLARRLPACAVDIVRREDHG